MAGVGVGHRIRGRAQIWVFLAGLPGTQGQLCLGAAAQSGVTAHTVTWNDGRYSPRRPGQGTSTSTVPAHKDLKQLPRWGSFRGQGPAWGPWSMTHSFQVWMCVVFMGSDSSQALTEFPWYPQEHILTTCTLTYSTMKQGRLEEVDGN